MFGMGGSEIIVILIVALLFLGPDKLPQAAKSISKGIRDLKKQSRALQNQIESDEQIGGAIRDLKSALRGEEAPRPRTPAKPPQALPEGEPVIETTPITTAESLPLAAIGEPASPAPAAPSITLPLSAGEPDPDVQTDGDEGLAAMIKPAAGTVAKGS